MLKTISNFFTPLPSKPHSPDEEANRKRLYKYRWGVFLSATIGYALFYVCRLSISVVKKPLVDEGVFSETQLGSIGAALFFSYAIGKLVNGFISDRINVNRFIGIGLLLTAFVNIIMGFYPLFTVFLLLWGINGWFQSAGAAPCVVALTRWFNPKERGTYYGIWSASHNIGKGITFSLLPFLMGIGGWKWGFWGAGALGMLGAVIVFVFLHDSPESKGLPPVGEESSKSEVNGKDVSTSQREILRNPHIWILALASALMYISRYAIESWGIFYAQASKGYSNVEAAKIIGLTAVTGIIGTAASGFISDFFFKGSRNVPALLAGLFNVASLAIFLFYPHASHLADSLAMLLHGLAIGILITFVGGLMAVDIAPKKATGAAMGLIGIASYAGAGVQELLSGIFISGHKQMVNGQAVYDFTVARYFWFGAAVLSVVMALLVWNAKRR